MKTEFIVQTASAPIKNSWKWQHPRRRVAVLEVDYGVVPKMISERARGVVRIVDTWECCYVGSTSRCQYSRALSWARDLAAQLNRGKRKEQDNDHHGKDQD